MLQKTTYKEILAIHANPNDHNVGSTSLVVSLAYCNLGSELSGELRIRGNKAICRQSE